VRLLLGGGDALLDHREVAFDGIRHELNATVVADDGRTIREDVGHEGNGNLSGDGRNVVGRSV